MTRTSPGRLLRSLTLGWAVILFVGAGVRVLADCASFGLPFTDLGSETTFCAAIAEAYYTGITGGTSATTFSPTDPMTREQAVAFATRSLDAALTRSSRRAALGQWWTTTPHYDQGLGLVPVGNSPRQVRSDGSDLWVSNLLDGTVTRIRSSDGAQLGTWTGTPSAEAVLPAMGRVFVSGRPTPLGNGEIYVIDPTQPPGAAAAIVTIPGDPVDLAFDGNELWSADDESRSVSIITPDTWSVTTVSLGTSLGTIEPVGLLYDGGNMWVTVYNVETLAGYILRLNADGSIAQTVSIGNAPGSPIFDGRNIWVPNRTDDSLSIVRSTDGSVIKTFSSANGNQNGLSEPIAAAFDGQRVLVTDNNGGVSLFRATDLSIIGFFPTPGVLYPSGVCSDGNNFWIVLDGSAAIGRF